jgi:putative DNA primase/helicase
MNGIPQELRDRPQWVCWRLEDDQARNDTTKRPYQPKRPDKRARTNDPRTWADYDAAREAMTTHGFDGVGFVFTDDDPYVGIDLDKCIDPDTGDIEEWAAGWALRFQTFTEYSPSGTGMHLIARGELPVGGRKHNGVEVYDTGRYFTVTGHNVNGMPDTVEHRQDVLEELLAEHFPANRDKPATQEPVKVEGVPADDADLLQLAKRAANGQKFRLLYDHGDTSDHGGDDSAADMALCVMLAFWTGKDAARIDRLFRASKLMRDKWDRSVGADTKYGAQTIARAIEACNDVFTPREKDDNQEHEVSGAASAADAAAAGRRRWVPILEAVAEAAESEPPSILANEQGQGLLYPGKRHLLAGEPETLKTLCMQIAAVQVLRDGGQVAWFDYDGMGRGELLRRLREVGATEQDLAGLGYVDIDEAIDSHGIGWFEQEYGPLDLGLVVIDAYDPALVAHGYNPHTGADIEAFLQRHVNPFHRAGAAVVILDHLVKNPESRGMYSGGSYRKTAAADVSLRMEHVGSSRLSIATPGSIRVRVLKDRPGRLHRGSGGAAALHFTPLGEGRIGWTIEFSDPNAPVKPFRPTQLMENVSIFVEQATTPPGVNDIKSGVKGKDKAVNLALQTLTAEGYVTVTTGPRNGKLHTSAKPYRQADDPLSDQHQDRLRPTEAHRGPTEAQAPVVTDATEAHPLTGGLSDGHQTHDNDTEEPGAPVTWRNLLPDHMAPDYPANGNGHQPLGPPLDHHVEAAQQALQQFLGRTTDPNRNGWDH